MTKEETIKILAMLNAFYAGGKNDPQQQVVAWHMILGKYEYEAALKAVLRFAENDVREYASFPAVGAIVKLIREEKEKYDNSIKAIIHHIAYGRPYDQHSLLHNMIDKDVYNEWLNLDAEFFSQEAETFAKLLWLNGRELKGGRDWVRLIHEIKENGASLKLLT